jgi:hypothetical protein
MHLFEDNPSKAEHILESAPDQHPLTRCLLAWHRQSWQEAIDAVSTWSPESVGDRALKLQMLARLTVGAGDPQWRCHAGAEGRRDRGRQRGRRAGR